MQDLVFEKLGGRGEETSCAKAGSECRGDGGTGGDRGVYVGYSPRGRIGEWALMRLYRVLSRLCSSSTSSLA